MVAVGAGVVVAVPGAGCCRAVRGSGGVRSVGSGVVECVEGGGGGRRGPSFFQVVAVVHGWDTGRRARALLRKEGREV